MSTAFSENTLRPFRNLSEENIRYFKNIWITILLIFFVIFMVLWIFVSYYFIIALILLLFLLLPIEPVIGIPLMFMSTGFDLFAQILKSEEHLYSFTYFHIIMLLTFVSVFLNQSLRRKITLPSGSLWAPVLAFLTMIAVSLIYTPNFFDGFMEFVRLAVLCALAYSITICVNTKGNVKFVAWSYVLIPFGSSIYTFYEIFTEGEFYKSQVINVASQLGLSVYRSTGTFHNPNILACFLMIGITVGFGLLFVRKINLPVKVFLLSTIVVTSIALVASFSRGGWLATFVAVFVLVVLHRRWSYFALFSGLFIFVLLILSIKAPEIVLSAIQRFVMIFSPEGEDSSLSRISLVKMGIWMWQDHPLLGVGAGGFPYYAPEYIDPNMPRALVDITLPHTLQSKILAEEGLIGITIAVWFIFAVLFDSLRSIKLIKDDFLKNTQIALTALFFGYMVSFTFSSDLHNNIFWITIGVLYAIPIVNKNIQKTEITRTAESTIPSYNDSS